MATIASSGASTHPRVAGAPTDHDLVAAVRRGDDRAFEVLYERYLDLDPPEDWARTARRALQYCSTQA